MYMYSVRVHTPVASREGMVHHAPIEDHLYMDMYVCLQFIQHFGCFLELTAEKMQGKGFVL